MDQRHYERLMGGIERRQSENALVPSSTKKTARGSRVIKFKAQIRKVGGGVEKKYRPRTLTGKRANDVLCEWD